MNLNQTDALERYSNKGLQRPNRHIYLANMMQMVRKVRRLSNLPPVSTDELEKIATDWTEILLPTIPIEDIPAVYVRAAASHKTSFAPTAFDFLNAFRTLSDERRAAEYESRIIAEAQAEIDEEKFIL